MSNDSSCVGNGNEARDCSLRFLLSSLLISLLWHFCISLPTFWLRKIYYSDLSSMYHFRKVVTRVSLAVWAGMGSKNVSTLLCRVTHYVRLTIVL